MFFVVSKNLIINIICYPNSYMFEKQNPVNQFITGFKVESEGIEPSSKQAIKGPSTRLFFSWFFVC